MGKKAKRLPEKLKIQPETWSLPRSCIFTLLYCGPIQPKEEGHCNHRAGPQCSYPHKRCKTAGDKPAQSFPLRYHTRAFAKLQAGASHIWDDV